MRTALWPFRSQWLWFVFADTVRKVWPLKRFLTGKSTLLAVLGNREVPIPDHIDIFHLTREMPASDKTALQCVMEVDEERVRLEKLAEELAACEDEGNREGLLC